MSPNQALPTLIVATVVIGIPIFLAWLAIVVNCANATFEDPSAKTPWTIIVVFLGPIGGLLYLIAAKRNASTSTKRHPFDA